LNDILDALFPAGHTVKVANQVITGVAQTAQGTVAVLGTTDAAAIDHAMALALSGTFSIPSNSIPAGRWSFWSTPVVRPCRAVRSCCA
jgi:hypothetical protein